MRRLVFTVAMTCASRGMILRDKLRGLPRAGLEDARVVSVRCRLQSNGNLLDAVLAEPVGASSRGSVLICHGIGETVEHWQGVQGLLAEHGIASLVFNYSGFGRSTGKADAEQWERDAVEAFRFLEKRVAGAGVSLLGYSLGSGVASAIVGKVEARRLVLCSAFTSLRRAAMRCGVPRWVAGMLPNIWDNVAALRRGLVPVLIAHGMEDRLFPAAMAEELAGASGAACKLVVAAGVAHNGPIVDPRGQAWTTFWRTVILEVLSDGCGGL